MQVTVSWDMKEVDKMMQRLQDAGMSGTTSLVQGGGVIEAHAKINLNSQGLHKTGQLANSIQVYDKEAWSVKVGSVGVIYAAIHEFGGVIKAKRVKALHWVGEDGKDYFAKSVRIPARPYLRPAVDENKSQIIKAIADDIRRKIGAA